MKDNIKKITLGILVILAMGCLSGCCLSHDWQEATCTRPRTCIKCGETEGEALGHEWQEATCTTAKTCKVCGATKGEPLGHKWQKATCTKPQTCSVCLTTSGSALEHEWQEVTCTKPRTCVNCRTTDGEALGHRLNAGGFCLTCDEQFGKEITKDTFEDYFEITCSDRTVSPVTITIKPKSSKYTYCGGKAFGGYMQPTVQITMTGLTRSTDPQHRNYDILYSEVITTSLNDNGYKTFTYNWSGTRAIRVAVPQIEYVSIYCYPKQ